MMTSPFSQMEAVGTSETLLITYRTIRWRNPEDENPNWSYDYFLLGRDAA
jgi:hypothetical protein